VISRRYAGLGDGIVSAIAAWNLAKRTGRTLVIDWRWSFYLKEKQRNAFSSFFDVPSDIDGVPLIADDSVADISVPATSRWRGSWQSAIEVMLATLYRLSPAKEMPHPLFWSDAKRHEVKLMESGCDPEADVVLLQSCLNEVLPDVQKCREFLRSLKPKQEIQEKIDLFAEEHFLNRSLIAVHVRHGNGGNIMDHTAYWVDRSGALNTIVAKINECQDKLGGHALVFLCTDSIEMKEQLNARFPKMLTRPKYFRAPQQGELHSKGRVPGRDPFLTGRDAIIEMFLLARADELILYPPGSFFSYYARTMRSDH
jgi:Nodulation protein Z (NodZ)